MEEQVQVTSMPRIGDKAPEFKAKTTQGDINFPSDYKGKLGHPVQSPGRLYPGMYHRVYDLCLPGGEVQQGQLQTCRSLS